MNLFDFFQQFRIEQNQRRIGNISERATDATFDAGQAKIKVQSLEDKIDHLSLVCMAMCELFEEIGFNKKMLEAKIKEIDLRDGKLDGKFEKTKQCSGCGRELSARHFTFLYCGVKLT